MNKLIKFLIERDPADYDVDVPDLQDKKEYKTHISLTGEDVLNPALMVPPKKKKKRKYLYEPPVVESDLLEIEALIHKYILGEQKVKEKQITPDEAAALAAAGEPEDPENIEPGPAGTISDNSEKDIDPEEAQALAAAGEPDEEDYAGSPDEMEKDIDPEEAQALSAAGQPDDETGAMDPNMMNSQGMDPNAMGGAGMDPNTMAGMGATDPNAMGATDPNAMGAAGGIDPTTGMPLTGAGATGATFGAGEEKSAEQLGRIFELKKIYSRLLSIDQYLSFSSDEVLLKLKKYVSKSIEFFEMLISNIDAFKDKIDDIIVVYYEFLKKVYVVLRDYYDLQEEKSKDIKDNKK